MMNRTWLSYFSIIFCLTCGIQNKVIFAVDGQLNYPLPNAPWAVTYPLEQGKWIAGIFDSSIGEDHFFFEAQKGTEYFIILEEGTEGRFELSLYSEDGNTLLSRIEPFSPSGQSNNVIRYTFSSSGIYYITVKPYMGLPGSYFLSVQTASSRFTHALSLVQNNQSRDALNEMQVLLASGPDDPEINLYTAILRLVDIVETPDNRLQEIYRQFGIDFDFFPASSTIKNPTDTMMKLSELQSYAVENVLPCIDQSLRHLEKVIQHPDVQVFIPPIVYEKKANPKDFPIDPDKHVGKIGWVQVDNSDVRILAGILLLSKSMILSLNAFDMGMEPKIMAERFYPNLLDPMMLDSLLIEYPNLLSGKADIQAIFRSSLQNWLLGTQKIREGLLSIAKRNTPQDVHMFYLETGQIAESAARYLSLLDRVFTGLLTVTGGDFNGDSVVDYWDLHDLQNTIRPYR